MQKFVFVFLSCLYLFPFPHGCVFSLRYYNRARCLKTFAFDVIYSAIVYQKPSCLLCSCAILPLYLALWVCMETFLSSQLRVASRCHFKVYDEKEYSGCVMCHDSLSDVMGTHTQCVREATEQRREIGSFSIIIIFSSSFHHYITSPPVKGYNWCNSRAHALGQQEVLPTTHPVLSTSPLLSQLCHILMMIVWIFPILLLLLLLLPLPLRSKSLWPNHGLKMTAHGICLALHIYCATPTGFTRSGRTILVDQIPFMSLPSTWMLPWTSDPPLLPRMYGAPHLHISIAPPS